MICIKHLQDYKNPDTASINETRLYNRCSISVVKDIPQMLYKYFLLAIQILMRRHYVSYEKKLGYNW